MNFPISTNFLSKLPRLPLPSNTSRLWPAIAVLGFLALIVVFLATQPFAASVVSTNPADQATSIPVDSSITITFNRPIPKDQQSQFTVTVQPAITGQLTFDQTNAAQATWKPTGFYQGDTPYTVIITGPNLREHRFTFRTRPRFNPIGLFPTNAPGPGNPNDPKQILLRALPYRTDLYMVQHTSLGDNIYITIYEQPIERNKAIALDWLKKFGFNDPENQLNVRYNIPQYLNPDYLKNLTP